MRSKERTFVFSFKSKNEREAGKNPLEKDKLQNHNPKDDFVGIRRLFQNPSRLQLDEINDSRRPRRRRLVQHSRLSYDWIDSLKLKRQW